MAERAYTSPFQRIKVQNHLLGGTQISWDMRRNFRESGDYQFTVQVGQNVDVDDWLDVNSVPVLNLAGAVITDSTRRIWSGYPRIYYRIKLVTGENTHYSEPQQAVGLWSRRDWLLARQMSQNEALLHRKYGGVHGLLLKQRQFGTPCPGYENAEGTLVPCREWDTGMVVYGRCPTCYGTGYRCGYYPAVDLAFTLTQKQEDREPTGERGAVSDVMVQGRGLAWPLAESQDVWIQQDTDQRYIVDAVANPAEFRGIPVFQEVELRLAPTTDIIYTLPRSGSPCPAEEDAGYYGGYAYI